MAGRTQIQKKTFTRWVNTHLADRDLKVVELGDDFKDGVLLLHLLEIISGKKIRKWKKNPKRLAQMMENISKALKFITVDEKITLVNIGPQDIREGNIKIILGLIWTLILRYQINKCDEWDDGEQIPGVKKKKKKDGAKNELLKWVNLQLKPYGMKVKNFKKDWKNAQILSCLTDSLRPGLINVDGVAKGSDASADVRTKDIGEAMHQAEINFEIPPVMDASDMATEPDELSVMTYVSYFRVKHYELEELARASGKSYAEGPGLETGPMDSDEPREFTVYALTHDGKPMVNEGEMVVVTITDADGNDVKCDIAEPGSTNPAAYMCRYTAGTEGAYTITVKVKGTTLMGFPRQIVIEAAADDTYIKSCNFQWTIQAVNEDDEAETEGGDLFEVDLKNEKGEIFEANKTDNGDGTYTASYTIFPGQLYKVYANLNGEPLANTPFIHDLRNEKTPF